jgi:succinylarginine dihydrolase
MGIHPDSKLRELAMDCYRELFGKEAAASENHAGLECGYFAKKMPGIDMFSLGRISTESIPPGKGRYCVNRQSVGAFAAYARKTQANKTGNFLSIRRAIWS